MNFNFVEKTNPKTNEKYREAQFTAKLTSVSDNLMENKNGTEYVLCTVEFENAQGQPQTASAMIYKSNLDKGMKVGNEYLTTVRIDNSGQPPLIIVSHLTQAARASADAFGVQANTPVKTPANANAESAI